MSTWVPACSLDDLTLGRPLRWQHQGDRVVIVRTGEGVHAIDDTCPHEGYPLSRGEVVDCTLTCVWHNFKFDLRDGRCLKGDEDVRTWPVRVVDGAVQIDVTPPDPEVLVDRWLASLEAGLLDNAVGRALRDVVRLLQADVPPALLLGWLATFDARYAEYGTTHVMPVAADALRLLPRLSGVEAQARLIAQPLELAGVTHVRRPLRATPEPEPPTGSPEDVFAALRARVEAEDARGAEALFRGAVATGWRSEVLEPWLVRLCADHFLDFGHPLIYATKVFDLLEAVGWDDAEDLLGALIFDVVNATREEAMPDWTPWRRAVEAQGDLADLWPRVRDATPTGSPLPWRATVLDGRVADAVAEVVASWRAGAALGDVIDTLCCAAAERLWRFDPAHDADDTVQDGWLSATHRLTVAHAVRLAAERVDHPDVLRLVLQAVQFVNAAGRLDRATSPPIAPAGDLASLDRALDARDPDAADAATLACLERGEAEAIRDRLVDRVLADHLTVPIFAAHLLKTAVAALDEHDALPAADRAWAVRGVVRYAASPVAQRRLGRRAHEAVRLVVEGRVPRTLS